MKNLILLVILLALTVGCTDQRFSNNTIELPQVDQFTSIYNQNTKFNFVNSMSDTLVMTSDYQKTTVERSLPDDSTFFIDDYVIQLHSESNGILIVLLGTAFVSADLENINPSLNIRLMPRDRSSIWMDIRIDEMFATSSDETEFFESRELLNKEFSIVYSVNSSEQSSFSQLYYNEEYGVIGFRDENNILWRIDSVKK